MDIKATSQRIKWITKRNKIFKKSRMLASNQKQLSQNHETKSDSVDIAPGKEELGQFLEGIWSVKAKQKSMASQIKKGEQE